MTELDWIEHASKVRELTPEEIEFYKLMFVVIIFGIVIEYGPFLIVWLLKKLFNFVVYCYKKLFKNKIKEKNKEEKLNLQKE